MNAPSVERRTVDLSPYPDLVVMDLGLRVRSLRGLPTLIGFGPAIAKAVTAKPDGLLLRENLERGGMEAVYDGTPALGFLAFSPCRPARRRMFSARPRAGVEGERESPPTVAEEEP